jgi:hypothetical protein
MLGCLRTCENGAWAFRPTLLEEEEIAELLPLNNIRTLVLAYIYASPGESLVLVELIFPL